MSEPQNKPTRERMTEVERWASIDPWDQTRPLDSITEGDVELRVGDRVELRPRSGADILDLALEGKVAIIEAIEQSFDDEFHVAVVLEDDPGRDLGEMRQPGHRFFFRVGEVRRLSPGDGQ